MLSYRPGETFAHRLDPRSKLCFQAGFAVAAFADTTLSWLAGVYALAGLALLAGRLDPRRVARAYWVVFLVLALGPVIAGIAIGPPWFRVEPALASLRAVARIPPVLAVSAVYVYTTPVRATRGAVERLVPGRAGQLLGVGTGLVVRFFPLLVSDLRRIRTAMVARGGADRPVTDRARRLAVQGIDRALARSDRLAVALRARCFAWNPTLPALTFGRMDYPVVALGVALALSPLVQSAALSPLLATA
ncbi:energy-coupling factor transporter transmembrane protein EcfT [Halomicrobium sp. IBSBa]|uniref:energy-coupling factor transporter transmembrane component T family protein n=1 Tax=Halomicrobium sp. IBSBa TaxID=2778916 RepID=UPI001ABFEFD2|nr:energy-coupling factor transporter transmembrane component T [Halomicrobium sp. IBSBa]MBO4247443.1 energy-coupling factor transporter transmembrane protein EcfT [Halomicrobium sp. IBSBa]